MRKRRCATGIEIGGLHRTYEGSSKAIPGCAGVTPSRHTRHEDRRGGRGWRRDREYEAMCEVLRYNDKKEKRCSFVGYLGYSRRSPGRHQRKKHGSDNRFACEGRVGDAELSKETAEGADQEELCLPINDGISDTTPAPAEITSHITMLGHADTGSSQEWKSENEYKTRMWPLPLGVRTADVKTRSADTWTCYLCIDLCYECLQHTPGAGGRGPTLFEELRPRLTMCGWTVKEVEEWMAEIKKKRKAVSSGKRTTVSKTFHE